MRAARMTLLALLLASFGVPLLSGCGKSDSEVMGTSAAAIKEQERSVERARRGVENRRARE
jgi:hypothetical protein